MAWPPSWCAPSSKLVRVRIEGLKNSSAMDLPASCLPDFSRLNAAACSSRASSSARLKSWVVMKWRSDMADPGNLSVPGSGSRPFPGRDDDVPAGIQTTKNPARGRVWSNANARDDLSGRIEKFRSARARGHAGGHAGAGQDDGVGAEVVHGARIMPADLPGCNKFQNERSESVASGAAIR